MSARPEAVQAALAALKQGNFPVGIQLLEGFLTESLRPHSPLGPDAYEVLQAQMYLVKAYQQNQQPVQARRSCQELWQRSKSVPQIHGWAQQTLMALGGPLSDSRPEGSPLDHAAIDPVKPPAQPPDPSPLSPDPEPDLSPPLPLSHSPIPTSPVQGSHAVPEPLKSTLTLLPLKASTLPALGLTVGLILVPLTLLAGGALNQLVPLSGLSWLITAASLAINLGIVAFFASTWVIDHIQSQFCQTRWIQWQDFVAVRPELGEMQQLLTQSNLKMPRLGFCPSAYPNLCTYGAWPDQSRLVISQGLLRTLSGQELVAVVGHGVGRIQSGATAVLTWASFWPQLAYWGSLWLVKIGTKNPLLQMVSHALKGLFRLLNYPLLYLARQICWQADYAATQYTHHPQSLVQALVKTSLGLRLRAEKDLPGESWIESTRLMACLDPFTTLAVANAVIRPDQAGGDPVLNAALLRWDLTNPWATLMAVNSSHPLPGRRLLALSRYAQQLHLTPPIAWGSLPKPGSSRLGPELLLYLAEVIGLLLGWMVGLLLYVNGKTTPVGILGGVLVGFGLGLWLKVGVMFPTVKPAPEKDVASLQADPTVGGLRGRMVLLRGRLLASGPGSRGGVDFEDATGILPLYGWLSFRQRQKLVGSQVAVIGWFRRGEHPWLDIHRIQSVNRVNLNQDPRWWLLGSGLLLVTLGMGLLWLPPAQEALNLG